MKHWWKKKDYIGIIPEKNLTKDLSIEQTVDMILKEVMINIKAD